MKEIFYDWFGLNEYLFTIINSNLSHFFLPNFFYFISIFSKELVFLIYYAIFIVFKIKSLGQSLLKYKVFEKCFSEVAKIGSIYTLVIAVYTALKYGVNFPRPYCSLPTVFSVQNFTNQRCLSSFPSAHTAIAAITCYCFFSYAKNKKRKACLIALIPLVGLSRIVLAMHYPADILYSICIAFFICLSINKIFTFKYTRTNLIKPIAKRFWNKAILYCS